jgi:hypothetical protein
MKILGPLPRTKHGNRFLLFIADRFSKVTKAVPLRTTVTALSVARAFCDHWAYVYGSLVSLLTDNGPQFTAKVFSSRLRGVWYTQCVHYRLPPPNLRSSRTLKPYYTGLPSRVCFRPPG